MTPARRRDALKDFHILIVGWILVATLGPACAPRPVTTDQAITESRPASEPAAGPSAGQRRGLVEDACDLLIDAQAIGDAWERGGTPDMRFDDQYGVAICGAIYSVLDWAQHPPASGPFVVGEAVYLAEQPASPAMILDLAKLRDRPLEVYEDPRGTATLDALDGPRVGEYSQWYRHTTTLTGDKSPESFPMLAVVLGSGHAYCVLKASGTGLLEPPDLVAIAEAASRRLGAYSPPG